MDKIYCYFDSLNMASKALQKVLDTKPEGTKAYIDMSGLFDYEYSVELGAKDPHHMKDVTALVTKSGGNLLKHPSKGIISSDSSISSPLCNSDACEINATLVVTDWSKKKDELISIIKSHGGRIFDNSIEL